MQVLFPYGPARYRAMQRVLLVVLATDLVLAAGKSAYGALTGSLAMVADGLHSLMHALGSLVAIIGVHLASRPPDPSHPYGYERYEPLAALGVAAFMLLAVREVLGEAWERLSRGDVPEVTGASFAVMGLSIAVGLLVALWEQRQAQLLSSQVLAADARRARSDALVSLSVVVGLAASLMGAPVIDLVVSAGIAGIIAWTAWTIIRASSAVLTDAAVADLDYIARVAKRVEGVRGVHRVRARGVAGAVRVDLHITVDPAMTVGEAHELTHRLAERVRAEVGGISEVLVHVGTEPEPEHEGDD